MATAQLSTLLRHIHRLAAGGGLPQRTDHQLLDDFSARQDEAAFAALLARHGPMVLRVCRRVLNHEHDAEDAFQATFLVLARHTGSIRKREALAQWLHGVAYRTAMEAKRRAARRRKHEGRLRTSTPAAAAKPTWDDVQTILDEEIQRLPEAFRSAFVLCVLEGKSGPEAAAELGVKEGTVSSRLTRARQRLQQQLARRGIKLAALLAALSVAESAGKGALPIALGSAAIRSGLLVAAGETAAGVIPAHVAALAAGVTRAMFLIKAKIATAVLLAAGLIAAAGALTHQALSAPERPQPAKAPLPLANPEQLAAKQRSKPAPPNVQRESVTYGGRVLGPDGWPVVGAKLYMTPAYGYAHRPERSPEYATTGPDGRFTFAVPKAKFGDQWTVVAAAAAKHGAGWVQVPAYGKRDELTVRLVDDDGPITGQIVDLEGKPVPGATLRVLQLNAAPGEDLGPWLKAAKDKKGLSLQLEQDYLKRYTIALTPKATTDGEGRFRLTGIGRNRLVRAQLDGPTIASQQLCILTRPGKTFAVTDFEGNPEYNDPRRVTTYYGANFRYVAAPTKPIIGVVRDRDTKKPLAGITIQSYKLANNPIHGMDIVQTTTDSQGRYRLTGMPKGEDNKIMVVPPDDLPYVAIHAGVPDSPGLTPVTVDFKLKRGVWIAGKMTDKVTGKPLNGSVEYFSLSSNPNLRDYPGFDGTLFRIIAVKVDGSYRVVGLPGPGLVAVYYQKDPYLRAPEREDEYGIKEPPLNEPALNTAPYVLFFPSNYSALARVNPAKRVDSVKRDVTLDPGWTFKGTVLGPDGKPLAGARSFDLNRLNGRAWWEVERMKTAEFTGGFNPRWPRDILIQHLEKGLVAVAQPPKKNGGTVTVQMEPGAAVTGRLVDADGRPRAGTDLEVSFRPKGWGSWWDYSPERIKTDGQGRFRIEALVPGYRFRLSDGKGELSFGGALRSGRTKALGDVRMKASQP
ncbi:MAG TPA: sigma-70 family RNA polymerase sigma factor [Gemmataceae bacterium]|jgi:RNA polymerase sigma factor (sigma-70 family)|nr:sigma-70 family RNA polymerase sigma factor [Gemmataceae bacterium]